MTLLELLDIHHPIVQAPMAGTSTPELAAAVANAGGLGSLGIGAMDAAAAAKAIGDFRARSNRSLNVNVFCHRPARKNPLLEAAWCERLQPEFARFGAHAPDKLGEIYKSFVEDPEMLALLLETRPKVVSFHFGLPQDAWIRAMKNAGIVLLATATNLDEARAIADAGIDAIVAQGYEAGGHRGIFDPDAHDDQLGTFVLTQLLAKHVRIPVIAAGGIIDGNGIAAALRIGASAAQLGTAFVACPESAADAAYRAALASDAANHTVMTRVISGRPARCLANRFTEFGKQANHKEIPSYPNAYDVGKALNAAAKAAGETGYGAQWAGQGAPLARVMPAAQLIATLTDEMR